MERIVTIYRGQTGLKIFAKLQSGLQQKIANSMSVNSKQSWALALFSFFSFFFTFVFLAGSSSSYPWNETKKAELQTANCEPQVQSRLGHVMHRCLTTLNCFFFQGRAFIFGGESSIGKTSDSSSSHNYLTSVEALDLASGSWTLENGMQVGRIFQASAAVPKNWFQWPALYRLICKCAKSLCEREIREINSGR